MSWSDEAAGARRVTSFVQIGWSKAPTFEQAHKLLRWPRDIALALFPLSDSAVARHTQQPSQSRLRQPQRGADGVEFGGGHGSDTMVACNKWQGAIMPSLVVVGIGYCFGIVLFCRAERAEDVSVSDVAVALVNNGRAIAVQDVTEQDGPLQAVIQTGASPDDRKIFVLLDWVLCDLGDFRLGRPALRSIYARYDDSGGAGVTSGPIESGVGLHFDSSISGGHHWPVTSYIGPLGLNVKRPGE